MLKGCKNLTDEGKWQVYVVAWANNVDVYSVFRMSRKGLISGRAVKNEPDKAPQETFQLSKIQWPAGY